MLGKIALATGIFLLTKNQKPSIGQIHSKGGKNRQQCRNGFFSDSFGSGTCSHNGGVGAGGNTVVQKKKKTREKNNTSCALVIKKFPDNAHSFNDKECALYAKELKKKTGGLSIWDLQRNDRSLYFETAIDNVDQLEDLHNSLVDHGAKKLRITFDQPNRKSLKNAYLEVETKHDHYDSLTKYLEEL
ncbi:MAG: hypothetical protein ACRBFS_19420 [Aureispira sp.]